MKLFTIQEAADFMGVSRRHVQTLVDEAQDNPKIARWREKRDFVDLTPAGSARRTIRIIPEALGLPVTQ